MSCHSAFGKALKKAFTTASRPYPLDPRHSNHKSKTDTSDYALAAVLSLYGLPMENLHRIAFPPDFFLPKKLNYNVHDKELLAIFEAFKRLATLPRRLVDFDRHGQLITGIVAILSTNQNPHASTMHVASEYRSGFNLVIHFWPGKNQNQPDGTY